MYQTMHKQESSAGTKKIQTKLSSSVKSEKNCCNTPLWASPLYSSQYQEIQPKNKPIGLSDSLKETICYLYSTPMNDVKPCYNFTHPVQLYALEFTQNANTPAASDQEKHHHFQKTPPAKNLFAPQNGTIQRKYYNPSTNKIKCRPHETREIRAAKINTSGMALTAHHIIPWEKLKQYIETAFQITPSVSNTFLTLEAFTNKKFPIEKQDFIESIESRMENYHRYEYTIDDWIQHVCWNPKNIFIGPLANNRVDDPGKRTGDQKTSIDAHYAQPGTKSPRSEELTSLDNFDLDRRNRKTIGHMEQNITGYNPYEWISYTLDDKKYYYQKNDPYFENYVQDHYLYDASITRIPSEKNSTNTKYRILFYTLYNFSICDLTFRLNKDKRSPVNYLYRNFTVNSSSYNVFSYIIAIPVLTNSRRYDISFEVPGTDATINDLNAVIINDKGRKVECSIKETKTD